MPWIPATPPATQTAWRWLDAGEELYQYWDGAALQDARLLGWWTGTELAPALVRGVWDGAALQPLT